MAEQNSMNALMELVHREYGEELRRFCAIGHARADVEDVYQEVLVRIRERGEVLLDFDPNSIDFKNLVFRFAFNQRSELRRRLSLRQMTSLYTYTASRNGHTDSMLIDQLAAKRDVEIDYDTRERIQEALQTLDEIERTVLLSIVCDGERYSSVGDRFGLTRDTVSNLCRRAKRKLRNMLGSWADQEDGREHSPRDRNEPQVREV